MNSIHGRSLNEIFGSPDDWKFRSCMTLFAHVTPGESEFLEALEKYCRSEPDPKTLEILRAQARTDHEATPPIPCPPPRRICLVLPAWPKLLEQTKDPTRPVGRSGAFPARRSAQYDVRFGRRQELFSRRILNKSVRALRPLRGNSMRQSRNLGLLASALAAAAPARVGGDRDCMPDSPGPRSTTSCWPTRPAWATSSTTTPRAPPIVMVSSADGDAVSAQGRRRARQSPRRRSRARTSQFLMLDSSLKSAARQVRRSPGSADLPVLADELQLVGRALGVTTTAEAFVVDTKTWTIAYHGPIDDSFAQKKNKKANLTAALERGARRQDRAGRRSGGEGHADRLPGSQARPPSSRRSTTPRRSRRSSPTSAWSATRRAAWARSR